MRRFGGNSWRNSGERIRAWVSSLVGRLPPRVSGTVPVKSSRSSQTESGAPGEDGAKGQEDSKASSSSPATSFVERPSVSSHPPSPAASASPARPESSSNERRVDPRSDEMPTMRKASSVCSRPWSMPAPRVPLLRPEPSGVLLGRDSGVLPVGDRVEFNEDFDAYHGDNMKAAKALGLVYDPKTSYYVDVFGCPVRDKFGRPL